MTVNKKDRPLMHLFMHIGKLLNDRFRSTLSEKGIHFGQARILIALLNHGSVTQGVIGEGLEIKRPTVTNMVQKMEASGLIVRKRDQKDDRLINVTLTPKGRRAAKFAIKVMEQIENEICSEFSLKEIEALKLPLVEIRNKLGGSDPDL